MASTLRYQAEFRSIGGIDFIIYIDDADYFNNTQIADVGPDGFLLTYDGDDGNRMEPVVASSVTFDLHMDDAAVEALIDDIVGAAENRFKVKILRDGSLFFVGQILTDLITDADEWKPFVTITATDGIGRLKDIDYNNAGSPYSGRETLLEHIFNCLDKTGLDYFYAATEDYLTTQVDWWDAAHVVAAASDPLSLTDLDHSVFVSQDKNENYTYTNCYDVLRQILTIAGARVYYTAGQYRIEQINAREAATTEERTYDKDRTNISNDAAAAYGVTIDQTLRVHNRMEGGNYSYLPALDRVRIRYEHHTPDDILPQINWTQAVSTEYTYGEVAADGSKTKLRISGILHFLSNYFDAGASANPYNKSIWRLKVFLDNGSGTEYYLSREGVIGSFYPSYGSTVWNTVPSWFEVHTIATEVLVREEDLQINLTTPAIQSADTFTLKLKFEFLDAYALQPLVELQASQIAVDYNFAPTIEILEEGNIEDQDDIRIYEVTNGASSANSANIEITTRMADGPTANSPYRLKAYNGSAWVDSTAWKVGGAGTAYTIAELLARQIMAGQKVPVKKYNVPFKSADIRAHTKVTDGSDNLIFLRGTFRAKYDEWNGTWYVISVDETSITTSPTIIISKPPPKVPIGVIDEPPGGVVGTEPGGNQLIVGTLPINPEMTEMQDTANADTFTALDVNTSLDQISGLDTTPWGSTGEIVRLRLTTAGTLPEPLSAKTAYQFEIISATTVQIVGKDLTTTGSGTSTITPFFQNVTILSNDTFATQANQIVLGNSGAEQVLFSGAGAIALKLDTAPNDEEILAWNAANSQFELNTISGIGAAIDYYKLVTDGTTTATASGADTFKLRTANNILTIGVTNDDVTHGDNALFTVNQGNILATGVSWAAFANNNEVMVYSSTSSRPVGNANFTWTPSNSRISLTGVDGVLNIGENGSRIIYASASANPFVFGVSGGETISFTEGSTQFFRLDGADERRATITADKGARNAFFEAENSADGNHTWRWGRQNSGLWTLEYSASYPFVDAGLTRPIVINTSGQVGFGNNTAPSNTVDINGTLRVRSEGGGTVAGIWGRTSTGVLEEVTMGTGMALSTAGVLSTTVTSGVGGSGTLNFIPKFTPDGTTLGNSQLFDNGTDVGINQPTPSAKLHVRETAVSNNVVTIIENNAASSASYLQFKVGANEITIGETSTGNFTLIGTSSLASVLISGTAPTDSFTITSGGNVGIGIATALQPLHVVGNARVTGAYYDSTNSPGTSGQILSSTVTGTDWIDAPAAGVSTFDALTDTPGSKVGSDHKVLFVDGSNIAYSELYYNNANNRFGVNQSSPLVDLHVTADSAGVLALIETTAVASDAFLRIQNDNDSWDIGLSATEEFQLISNTGTTTPFKIHPNALSNSLYIASDADIGMGNSSPSDRLHINSSSNCFVRAQTTGTNTVAGLWMETNTQDWSVEGSDIDDSFQIVDRDSNNVVFKIEVGAPATSIWVDPSGDVGYNTSAPTAKVDINGSTGYNQLRLRTTYTPTSTADANGNTGDVAHDASYIYIKTSGGWKRSALSTF